MLERLNDTHWIVNVLLFNRESLLIVEPRILLRGPYCSTTRLDEMQIVNCSEGVTVAAALYWEPLSNREYIILLKRSGTLEILDDNLDRVDVFETGIEQANRFISIAVDERTERIFVNLEENAIYSISLQRNDSSIAFTNNSNNPTKIYEAPRTISFFEAAWHVNVKNGKDFLTIASLLDGEDQSGTLFEVIQQPQADSRKKKQQWSSLIELTNLDELRDPIESDGQIGTAALKSVPNVGFFIFSFTQTFFFILPSGPKHVIGGSRVGKYALLLGLSKDGLPEDVRDLVKIKQPIYLDQNMKGLEFRLLGNYPAVITAQLKLIFEESEEYIYSWDGFVSTCSAASDLTTSNELDSIERAFFLNSSTCAFWSRWSGLKFVNVLSLSLIRSISFSQPSALYCASVGYDFTKLISCCSLKDNKGILYISGEGYENFFHTVSTYASNEETDEFWPTEQSVWWKTSNGRLMHDGVEIKTQHETVHVTWDGHLLARNSSFWKVSNIWGDVNGGYVYFADDGRLRWSGVTMTAKIPFEKKDLMAPMILACIREQEGPLLTVVSLNEKLIIMEDDRPLTKDWVHIEADVSSIFIVPANNVRHIILGTSDGRIKLFDLITLRLVESMRLGSKRVGLCGVPESPYVFLYTKDDLLVLELDHKSKMSVARVTTDLKVTAMCAKSASYVYLASEGGKVFCFSMPEKLGEVGQLCQHVTTTTQSFNKFASFPSSNRLIVMSALSSKYSNARKRYINSALLSLYDVESRKELCCCDLSKDYPQATVSDIVAVPYEIPLLTGSLPQKLPPYAERLTLSKCFIVSLNYETADDDSLANLLLFSIDEHNCSIDFHLSLKTTFSVTAVTNHRDNTFMVAGEALQLFGITYLVQENIFRIIPMSNAQPISGYPIKIFGGLPILTASGKLTEFSDVSSDRRILVLSLLQGLQEYRIVYDEKSAVHTSGRFTKSSLHPIIGSERNFPFSDPSWGNGRVLVDCAWTLTPTGTMWFVTAYSDCNLEVRCREEGQEFNDEMKVRIKLESPITSVVSLSQRKRGLTHHGENLIIRRANPPNEPLFSVTTVRGDIFILKELPLREAVREQMEEAEE